MQSSKKGGSGSSTPGPTRPALCAGPASSCVCSSCGRKDSAWPTWATVIRISVPPSRRTSFLRNESSPSCAPRSPSPTPPSSISPTYNGTWGDSPEEFPRRIRACCVGSHLHLAAPPEAEFLHRDREAPTIVRSDGRQPDQGRRAPRCQDRDRVVCRRRLPGGLSGRSPEGGRRPDRPAFHPRCPDAHRVDLLGPFRQSNGGHRPGTDESRALADLAPRRRDIGIGPHRNRSPDLLYANRLPRGRVGSNDRL